MNRILNSVLKQHRTVVQVCVGSLKNSATIGGKRDSFFLLLFQNATVFYGLVCV